jgi:arabinofuranan 3-O-arabinosyltransferase
VPAGEGGLVETTYGPHRGYLLGLLGGLAVAALLNAAALALLLLRWWGRAPARWWPAAPRAAEALPSPTAGASPQTRTGLEVGAAVLLALISLPLALGAAVGRLTSEAPLRTVGIRCFVVVGLAGLLGVADAGSAVRPPIGSDLVAALVVGVVAGRVLGSRREDEVTVVSD